MEEIWKDITIENGIYVGIYQVSNLGRVKCCSNNATRKEKIITPVRHKGNHMTYLRVHLCRGAKQKQYAVHRLVANEFLGNYYYTNLQVDHIDYNTFNNSVSNLEWVTMEENNRRMKSHNGFA